MGLVTQQMNDRSAYLLTKIIACFDEKPRKGTKVTESAPLVWGHGCQYTSRLGFFTVGVSVLDSVAFTASLATFIMTRKHTNEHTINQFILLSFNIMALELLLQHKMEHIINHCIPSKHDIIANTFHRSNLARVHHLIRENRRLAGACSS